MNEYLVIGVEGWASWQWLDDEPHIDCNYGTVWLGNCSFTAGF